MLTLLLAARPAAAEEPAAEEPVIADPTPAARKHGAIAVGSNTYVTDFTFGVWGGASLTGWGERHRWGVRLDAYTPNAFDALIAEVSATYQLAAARPHLVIAGFFGAGVAAPDPAAVLVCGLDTQFRPLKRGRFPIGLELVVAAHLVTARDPVALELTSVLGLVYAW